MWQGSPLTSSPIQVQNGIDHFAHLGGSGVSTWLGGRDQWFEDPPLVVCYITGVASSHHLSTSSLPFFPFGALLPLLYHLAGVLAVLLSRPVHRPCPLSSGFSSLCTQPLIGTDLDEANLSGATLNLAIFDGVRLNRTNFDQATILSTIFVGTDLSLAIGLETVHHGAPSSIGIDTIYLSQGNIPENFLRGVGIDDTFITYIHSLIGKAIEYYSCFISYSSKDDAFARRLYADLQSQNVRCWFAPEDLKIGDKIRIGIDEAIRFHDKLLLILSKSSVSSGWVEREVKTALAKERKEKRTVLFPVRVDKAVFESPFDWATEIHHERNIGDFTGWKNHDDYQKAFTRLLRDLKAEPPRRL
jgi:hypothetical protein